MKLLLCSIGSRGDVQPLLALAIELKTLGHDARLCVPPDFRDWIESFGIACLPIGPGLRKLTGGTGPRTPPRPSSDQRRQLAAQLVLSQAPVLTEAARGCDLVVAAGALQIATRSVAEALDIRYVFVAYCPAVLPSRDHPPPKMWTHHSHTLPPAANAALWVEDEQELNELFLEPLNGARSRLGLAPVTSVRAHVFTDRPWLAADPVLGPAAPCGGMEIVQTGAWLLKDPRPLPDEVEEFLAVGAPPVYLGLGSMRATPDASCVLVEAARSLGLRCLLSQGWADLHPPDTGPDCLSVGDVAHEALFARVAAILHHGGAGTTVAAARAGKPQVVVPHNYDQHYFAHRVQQLGIGVAGPTREELCVETLTSALRQCLGPGVASAARTLAHRIGSHGARHAATRLLEEAGGAARRGH
jgi:vancomycin aglycone glucosyltransferase